MLNQKYYIDLYMLQSSHLTVSIIVSLNKSFVRINDKHHFLNPFTFENPWFSSVKVFSHFYVTRWSSCLTVRSFRVYVKISQICVHPFVTFSSNNCRCTFVYVVYRQTITKDIKDEAQVIHNGWRRCCCWKTKARCWWWSGQWTWRWTEHFFQCTQNNTNANLSSVKQ